jgi:hypothetical protein
MTAGARCRPLASILLAALLLGALGCARNEDASRSAEVLALYELSQVEPRIAAVREFLDAQLQLHRGHWTPEQFAVAERLIAERFSDSALSERILDRLEELHDPRYSAAVLEWLRSPETHAIHEDAGFSTGADQVDDFRAFIGGSGREPVPAPRLALIERYDVAARRSRDSARSLLFASYGVGLMSDALAPPDERVGPEAVRESAQRKNRLLEPFFEEISSLMLRFAFRKLSDEQIEAFVAYSESEPGQWYYGSLSDAFLGTLEEISNDLGAVFSQALTAQPDA